MSLHSESFAVSDKLLRYLGEELSLSVVMNKHRDMSDILSLSTSRFW